MKRSPLKRKPWKRKLKSKKESKGLFSHLETESKDEESTRIREELKLRFAAVGIISCELRLEGCTKAYNFGWTWSFAHSLKRGEIASKKRNPEKREIEIREVCYACGNCHNIIEKIGNKERGDGKPKMKDYVRSVIARREIQP